jgi:hypothetical protein
MASLGITATLILVRKVSDSAMSKSLIKPLYCSLPADTPWNPLEVGYISNPSNFTQPWLMMVFVDPQSRMARTLNFPATKAFK